MPDRPPITGKVWVRKKKFLPKTAVMGIAVPIPPNYGQRLHSRVPQRPMEIGAEQIKRNGTDMIAPPLS
ncbi:MAG: hypothetical protein HFE84_06315 [Lachnospiraceae bacterium]|nr:hypothetical protein [Lachnospiraceae bacterium]